MNLSEIREKSIEELNAQIEEKLKESLNLKLKRATDELKQPHRIKMIRREIAQMKTIINEKKRGNK